MTADELITALGERGIEISRRSLFVYQKIDPREAPEFGDVDAWARFIRERQVYEPGRTQSPEAKERRSMSRNGRQRVKRNQANGDSDPEKFSLSAERKERILRLRLSNQARRSKLQLLCASVITVRECGAIMERLRAVANADLLGVPVNLCHKLAHRDPEYIRQTLDGALRSVLDRLARPESYL